MLDIHRILTLCVLIILVIGKRIKINSYLVGVCFYMVTLLVSTIINHGPLIRCMNYICNIVAPTLFVYVLFHKDTLMCLDAMLFPMEILIYANLLTVLLFPNGMYVTVNYAGQQTRNNWLLGMDNGQAPLFLWAITVSVLRTYFITGKTKLTPRNLFLLVAILATVLICWQATIIVGMTIIVFALLFSEYFAKAKLLNIWTYFLIVAIVFALLVIFQSVGGFSYIIQTILRKDLTFSGRVMIWGKTIKAISQHPLLGYGRQDDYFMWKSVGHIHTHNMYLQTLYQGGILHFSVFIFVHLVTAKKLYKNNENVLSNALSMILFCLLIMFQVEAYAYSFWIVIFQLCYESDWLIHKRAQIANAEGIKVPRKIVLRLKSGGIGV